MLRTGLVAGALAMAVAIAPNAASAADPFAPNGAAGVLDWLDRQQNVDGFVTRHVANECLTAAVAAVALTALSSTGPAAPVLGMALGQASQMSTIAVAVTGCAAGAAAGMASAAASWAWDEREVIVETTATQVAWIYDGVTWGGAMAGYAVADGVSSLIGQSREVAATLAASAAFGIGGWWGGGGEPDIIYDIAAAPKPAWDDRLASTIQ